MRLFAFSRGVIALALVAGIASQGTATAQSRQHVVVANLAGRSIDGMQVTIINAGHLAATMPAPTYRQTNGPTTIVRWASGLPAGAKARFTFLGGVGIPCMSPSRSFYLIGKFRRPIPRGAVSGAVYSEICSLRR